jgi:hypothetical protein
MTVRLGPAARRKVERFAAREGISLNEALNRLIQRATDHDERPPKRRRYRLKPRKTGFGFDISRAKRLAAETADEETLRKLERRR